MKLRPEEITSILKDRIKQFDVETDLSEVGSVLQVGDGIARIHGLENCVALERLELEHGVIGIAFNLEEDNVGAALFGEWQHVKEGEPVRRTGEVMSVPVGEALLGRVVDPLGNPLDGLGPIEATERRPLEFKAPGVISRQPVKEPLQTGIKSIDSMIPIGRGQRELIIGDRSTGQDRDRDRHDPEPARRRRRSASTSRSARRARRSRRSSSGCATRARWSTRSSSRRPRRRPRRSSGWRRSPGARWASTSSTTGKHALSSTTTSRSTRTRIGSCLCCFAGRPAARRFPGDVFYLHSRLLERACKLSDDLGGRLADGAADHRDAGRRHRRVHPDERHLDHRRADLPRVEPLLLRRPPGDQRRHVGLARGRQRAAQAMSKVAGRLRLDLAQYRELEAFAQFGSELDAATQQTLARGERMVATLNQPQYQPWPFEEQVVAIYAGVNGYLDNVPVGQVPRFHDELREHLRTEGTVLAAIRESGDISDETEEKLKKPSSSTSCRSSTSRKRRGSPASGHGVGPGPQAADQSVRNTRKITRAMELVAAAKLRRAERGSGRSGRTRRR